MLQILYTIFQFLQNKVGIEHLLKQQKLLNQFLIFLNDKNKGIKSMADEILNILRVFFKLKLFLRI